MELSEVAWYNYAESEPELLFSSFCVSWKGSRSRRSPSWGPTSLPQNHHDEKSTAGWGALWGAKLWMKLRLTGSKSSVTKEQPQCLTEWLEQVTISAGTSEQRQVKMQSISSLTYVSLSSLLIGYLISSAFTWILSCGGVVWMYLWHWFMCVHICVLCICRWEGGNPKAWIFVWNRWG